VAEALAYAREHRSEFMWPWESPPRSAAGGILDDETYDWHAVVGASIATGGWPVVVEESLVIEAHALARETTGIPADATGSAGLAGLIALRRANVANQDERNVVLFTGREQ
jgi:threonine synthase